MKKFLLVVIVLYCTPIFAQKNNFNPDGFFYPTKLISLKNAKIECLELCTFDVDQDGNHKYHEPFVRVVIKQKSNSFLHPYKSSQAIISKDTLFFECSIKGIGVVHFKGTFIDKKGNFGERNDIEEKEILTGLLEITLDGKTIYSSKQKFTFFNGD